MSTRTQRDGTEIVLVVNTSDGDNVYHAFGDANETGCGESGDLIRRPREECEREGRTPCQRTGCWGEPANHAVPIERIRGGGDESP